MRIDFADEKEGVPVRKSVQRVLTLAVVSTLAGSVFLAASPSPEPRAGFVRVASGVGSPGTELEFAL